MRCLIIGGCTGGAVAPKRQLVLAEGKNNTPSWVWMTRELDRSHFGYLTTSFAIIDEDVAFLIDNGLGVQIAANAIAQTKPKQVVILQTHYHFDHIEGMHLNPLLYQPDSPITHFFGPNTGDVMWGAWTVWKQRLCSKPFWPISPRSTPTVSGFNPGESLGVASRKISTILQNHPGGSCGYRIPLSNGKVIVIATDIELASEDDQQRFARFVDGVDFLVVECQLRQDEYLGKVGVMQSGALPMIGWGHSTPEMILASLGRCKNTPRSVFATHHDSRRDQVDLRKFESEFRSALSPLALDCSFLYEAQDIDLDELEST